MSKIHLTARVEPEIGKFVKKMAKSKGVTHAQVIETAIKGNQNTIAEQLANLEITKAKKMAKGGRVQLNDDMKGLVALGGGTLGGMIGYHLAGYIRKEMEMDEDKGMQVFFGLIGGLVGIIATEKYLK